MKVGRSAGKCIYLEICTIYVDLVKAIPEPMKVGRSPGKCTNLEICSMYGDLVKDIPEPMKVGRSAGKCTYLNMYYIWRYCERYSKTYEGWQVGW